jgi:hypothetical protein
VVMVGSIIQRAMNSLICSRGSGLGIGIVYDFFEVCKKFPVA